MDRGGALRQCWRFLVVIEKTSQLHRIGQVRRSELKLDLIVENRFGDKILFEARLSCQGIELRAQAGGRPRLPLCRLLLCRLLEVHAVAVVEDVRHQAEVQTRRLERHRVVVLADVQPAQRKRITAVLLGGAGRQ
jgi:hypothetical protein